MKSRRHALSAIVGAAFAIAVSGPVIAQQYPDRAIRIVVPFPPGGTTDVLGRAIGTKLQERLGQPVIIDNRSGGGGTIGAAAVAKSPPDGYTLILGTIGTHGVNYALNEKLAYHPLKDFVPVIAVATVPNVLVVRTETPYKSLADLLAAARAQPGKLTHGSTGIGASPHLSLEVMKMMAKVDITDVRYKGSSPVMVDLLGGQVTMAFDGVATSIPMIEAGRLRPLAVSSKDRLSALPNVPSLAETFPGYDVTAWYAFWAPAGTPSAIVQKLNSEIDTILRLPDIQERMTKAGALIIGGSVEALSALHKREFDRWMKFIKETGIRTD